MTSATFSLGFPVKGPGKVEFERFEEEHVFSDGPTGPSMYSTPFFPDPPPGEDRMVRTNAPGTAHASHVSQHSTCTWVRTQPPALTLL